jgi:predicted extracellular nuclease
MKRIILILFTVFMATMLWGQVTVYDIQFTEDVSGDSPLYGQIIVTGGIVTALDGTTFYIADVDGGAWHGVMVYTNDDYGLALGDAVTFGAEVDEYYNLTELKNLTDLVIVSNGNPVPAPVVISTLDLSTMEAYEGVLVTIEEVEVTIATDDFGQWFVDDGSGECEVEDAIYHVEALAGDMYHSIT